MRAILDFVAATPKVLVAVDGAIRNGRGVDPSTFHHNYNHAVGRVNTPTYAGALVSDWINGVPGLTATLTAGGRVADLACGNGDAAVLLGSMFPAVTVVGFDLDPAVADRQDLPSNVSLQAADARALPESEEFDLVLCLDSLHHLGNPREIANQVHKILRPGGLFLVAESSFTGDLATDSANPFALIGYAAGLLYCLQENLAAGGSGNTAGDGPAWITDALTASGFAEVTVRASETGYNITTAIR
jgi:SAM-dependent methyltransferase